MAYKFQLGDAIMSGALVQEGTLEVSDDEGSLRFSVNRDNGLVSGSGNLRLVGSAHLKSTLNVSGAAVFGSTIAATTDGSSLGATSFNDKNITNVGDIALDTISADGASFSFGSNWTAAGRVCANLGEVTTVDINGGSVDAATIGAAVQSSGKFTSLSASGDLNIADNATVNGTAGVYGLLTAHGGASMGDANITNVGDIALDSISADGASFSFGSNWTATTRTCADLGSVTTADLNGGSIDGMTIGVASQSSGQFTSLSASGDLNIADNATVNGTVIAHGILTANAGVKATSLSASSTLTVVGATTLGRNNGATTFSGSTVRFYGLADDADFAEASDSLFYYDAGSKSMKRMLNSVYLGDIAGAGLKVDSGKLTTDAATGVIRWGNAAVTLQEGFNVATASLSQARTWTLPASPDISDVVRVKKDDSAYALTIAGAGSQMIDGQASLLLESPSGSVSLVYVATNRWSVY